MVRTAQPEERNKTEHTSAVTSNKKQDRISCHTFQKMIAKGINRRFAEA